MNHSLYRYKKRMLILCIMLAVVLMITGVSYAVFTNYSSQTDANTLAASCMDLEFNGQNEINLLNTYPISEGEALEQTPYTFTIKNKCDNYIEYYVIASVISTTNKVDSKYVKVSLLGDNDLNGTVINTLESISTPQSLSKYSITENYILKRGDGISKDESRTFNFRMWLDSSNKDIWTREDIEGKDYQIKISVVGTVRTRPKDDLFIAALINGEESTSFPTTGGYTASVECTRNGKKIDVNESITWNGTKWILTTAISDGNVRCNATFITKVPTLAETILANNEVKTPITTPGKEVSAYKESDVTTTNTYKVDNEEQYYYVTYGTGWKANGSKFNLTGTSVTTDTYANSYASLVGKYLPQSSINSSGSGTAGTMKTTTNLSAVYYVVSATQDSFTYKTISSNKNTTEALLASTEDDYGTSYYFRGAVTNNYVEFANKCWRIVRVSGDGSVKLILHNDNKAGVVNPCDAANNSASAAFARYSGETYKSAFNTNYNDNAYVGFKYGTVGAGDYALTHANTNKSTILTNLEAWYEKNNLKNYEKVIADTVWCNDKTNVTDTSYDPWSITPNGLGYAKNVTYYGATQRLVGTSGSAGGTGPSLKCNGELSKINSKVGLITADELAFAGYAYNISNTTTYLQENATDTYWWSLSPNSFDGVGAGVWYVSGGKGNFGNSGVNGTRGVRPSISLKSTTNVTGEGTSSTPYIIST